MLLEVPDLLNSFLPFVSKMSDLLLRAAGRGSFAGPKVKNSDLFGVFDLLDFASAYFNSLPFFVGEF